MGRWPRDQRRREQAGAGRAGGPQGQAGAGRAGGPQGQAGRGLPPGGPAQGASGADRQPNAAHLKSPNAAQLKSHGQRNLGSLGSGLAGARSTEASSTMVAVPVASGPGRLKILG